MAEQTEKAFLKQPKVFLSSKKTGKGKRPGKGGNRFWKSIGLGFKTPREAVEDSFSSYYFMSAFPSAFLQLHLLTLTLDFNVVQEHILIRNAHLLALFLLEAVSLPVLAIVQK
ncbi:hypothetical protein CXB51_021773 [Gossypium anomalum]|uniref:Small ribosomal subunit protein uS17 N-terminal domain-containing protein n=1 Tax=Gossypium anomalum TaxID=47600 RepID=A0A8J5YSD4_9ROSI|nr:hypothetical protein CXB51_021773 [Gossypium anomalum]